MERKHEWSEEKRQEAAERMRKLNADPVFKEKVSKLSAERMRKLHADPVFKEKTAERMRKLHADPVFKEKTAERMRKLNADPVFKEKLRAANPLSALTPQQRENYDVLVKKGGFKRKEALQSILGESATI